MGFTTDADPNTTRYGPQPYEGYVADVCELFGCTPDVAERQDYQLVNRIAEYRGARQAVALFNEGAKGMQRLAQAPRLAELLRDMMRAQQDADVEVEHIYGDMARRAEVED